MKKIELTQGHVALVDDEDYERINAHKWCAILDPKLNSYYAARNAPRGANYKQRMILMHREIMNAQPGEHVDHINHATLDNQQKSNLRICTSSQNHANQRMQSNNKSGFKGVSLHRQTDKWQAQVGINGKYKYLGLFVTAIEAAVAYDAAALKYHGEHARTNAMMGLLPKDTHG